MHLCLCFPNSFALGKEEVWEIPWFSVHHWSRYHRRRVNQQRLRLRYRRAHLEARLPAAAFRLTYCPQRCQRLCCWPTAPPYSDQQVRPEYCLGSPVVLSSRNPRMSGQGSVEQLNNEANVSNECSIVSDFALNYPRKWKKLMFNKCHYF